VSKIHELPTTPFRDVARWDLAGIGACLGAAGNVVTHYLPLALPATLCHWQGIRPESATWLLWSWDPVAVPFKP